MRALILIKFLNDFANLASLDLQACLGKQIFRVFIWSE
jgi:hypothetical protein